MLNNYNTSKDYNLLWELAKTQEVICKVDYRCCRDVCIAKSCTDYKNKTYTELSSRGIEYIGHDDKNKFIEACSRRNVEFIIPNAWISVKDRLPGEDGPCLTMRDHVVRRAFFFKKLLEFYGNKHNPLATSARTTERRVG